MAIRESFSFEGHGVKPDRFRKHKSYQGLPLAITSASLIGRLGSSAFGLSTSTVSMSLTGSCFSSESAPRPFHHGIRRRGGTIFGTALPSVWRQGPADIRSHPLHSPARGT